MTKIQPMLRPGLKDKHGNALRKRKRKILLAVGVLIVAAAAWLLVPSSQPTYDGKTLTHWMAALGSADGDEEAHAFAAIQAIGTNALPTISRLLESSDSTFKLRCLHLAERIPFLGLRFQTAAEQRQQAKVALILAGSESQRMSVPTLARLSRAADAGVRITAVECLSQLLFTEREVISSLEAAQGDPDPRVSTVARDAVRRSRGVGDAVQRLQGNQARQNLLPYQSTNSTQRGER